MTHTHLKASSFFRRASSIALATLMLVNTTVSHADNATPGYTVDPTLQKKVEDAKDPAKNPGLSVRDNITAIQDDINTLAAAVPDCPLSDSIGYSYGSPCDTALNNAPEYKTLVSGVDNLWEVNPTWTGADSAAFDASKQITTALNAIITDATNNGDADTEAADKAAAAQAATPQGAVVDPADAATIAETKKSKTAATASKEKLVTSTKNAEDLEAAKATAETAALDQASQCDSTNPFDCPETASTEIAAKAVIAGKDYEKAKQAELNDAVTYANDAGDYLAQAMTPTGVTVTVDNSQSSEEEQAKAAAKDKAAKDAKDAPDPTTTPDQTPAPAPANTPGCNEASLLDENGVYLGDPVLLNLSGAISTGPFCSKILANPNTFITVGGAFGAGIGGVFGAPAGGIGALPGAVIGTVVGGAFAAGWIKWCAPSDSGNDLKKSVIDYAKARTISQK